MYLEAGNPCYSILRGTDLSRKIRKCCKVIPYQCRHFGEHTPGHLHTVAGVPDKLYNYLFPLNNGSFLSWS